jgi:hypothetical protein
MTSKALEAAGVMFERALSEIDSSAPMAIKFAWVAKIITAYANDVTDEMTRTSSLGRKDHMGVWSSALKFAILKGLEP